MISFRNKQLAALTVIAGLGIGAVATPAVALAASHPAHAKVVKSDPASPDKPGTRDGRGRDTKLDTSSSLDKGTGVEKSTGVDPKRTGSGPIARK
jgi:hypothetical protein